MRSWIIKTLLMLTAALLSLAAAGQLLAAPGDGASSGYFGEIIKVTTLGPDSVTVTLDTKQGLKEIDITSDTGLIMPGNEEPSIDDLASGQSLAVSVKKVDGRLVAVKALVKPKTPTLYRHIVGVVASKDNNQITLVNPEGKSVTIDLPIGFERVEVGEALTAIVKHDITTKGLYLQDVRTAQQAIVRLNEQVKEATANWTLRDLKVSISVATEQHLSILAKVANQVTPQVELVLNQVLQSRQQDYQLTLSNLNIAPPAISVEGVIVLRDSFRKTITVLPGKGRPIQLTVISESEITVEGRPGTFSDLELGHRIRTKYDTSSFEIRAVDVVTRELTGKRLDNILENVLEGEAEGRITQINSSATPPTVTFTLTEGGTLTLSVPQDAKIIVSDREVDLGYLPLAARVKIRYNAETNEALDITADASLSGESFISGVVSGLRKKARVITITTPNNATIIAGIAKDAPIWRNEMKVTIAEVRIGDVVRPTTRYNAGTREILALSLRSPTLIKLEGVIVGKASSSEGDSYLTVSTPRLELVRLRISTIAIIQRNDQRATFDDVHVGDRVKSGTYNPSNMEAVTLELESAQVLKTHGTITSVDTGARTFIVQPPEGEPVNLVFSFATEAEKNGASDIFISQLHVGDTVLWAAYKTANGEVLKMSVLSADILTARGLVKEVDLANRQVTIATVSGDVILRVTDDTKVVKNGKSILPIRLAKRDIVTAAYYRADGTATRIVVRSPNVVITAVTGPIQVTIR